MARQLRYFRDEVDRGGVPLAPRLAAEPGLEFDALEAKLAALETVRSWRTRARGARAEEEGGGAGGSHARVAHRHCPGQLSAAVARSAQPPPPTHTHTHSHALTPYPTHPYTHTPHHHPTPPHPTHDPRARCCCLQELTELNTNSERLARSYNELLELQLVLER